MSGSFQQNLASVCNGVSVWRLIMGWMFLIPSSISKAYLISSLQLADSSVDKNHLNPDRLYDMSSTSGSLLVETEKIPPSYPLTSTNAECHTYPTNA